MRGALALIAGTLLGLGVTSGVTANTPTESGKTANYEMVHLDITSSANSIKTAAKSGFKQWNRSACNTGGIDFPVFTTSAGAGRPRVAVILASGLGDAIGTNNSTSCGYYSGTDNGSSGTVTLHAKFKASNGTTYGCNLTDAAWVSDLIAHELGHYLGLQDTPCKNGSIMGPVSFDGSTFATNRRPNTAECNKADDVSWTFTESTNEDCGDTPDCGNQNDGQNSSPILLDLGGDGFAFSGLDDAVSFDIDADGKPETIGWVARGSDDVFLALDRNGNGLIDDGAELFGDNTLQPPSERPNGYAALAVFDGRREGGNGDGFITPQDVIYDSLRLWRDENRDGVSQPWELTTLSWAGVEALSLSYYAAIQWDSHGNQLRYLSAFLLTDGRVLPSVDVFFVVAP